MGNVFLVAGSVLSLALMLPASAHAVTVRDSNGVMVGELESMESHYFVVTNSKGYITAVNRETGNIGRYNIIYLDSNCTGQRYAQDALFRPFVLAASDDVETTEQLFSVAADIEPVVLTQGDNSYSWTTVGLNAEVVCYPSYFYDPKPYYFFPMLPNDPAQTGFGNTPFQPPFKISMSPLFLDGFDGV